MSSCLLHENCDGTGPECPKIDHLTRDPESFKTLTRADILFGKAVVKPEYGERLTRHWYGYCRTWFTQQATGKIRIWDPFHRWER